MQTDEIKKISQNSPLLKEINLSKKRLDDKIAKDLFKAISSNKYLTKIILTDNFFTDLSMESISQMMITNNTLEVLELEGNKFTQVGIKNFIKSLEKNRSLTDVTISEDATDSQLDEIDDILDRNYEKLKNKTEIKIPTQTKIETKLTGTKPDLKNTTQTPIKPSISIKKEEPPKPSINNLKSNFEKPKEISNSSPVSPIVKKEEKPIETKQIKSNPTTPETKPRRREVKKKEESKLTKESLKKQILGKSKEDQNNILGSHLYYKIIDYEKEKVGKIVSLMLTNVSQDSVMDIILSDPINLKVKIQIFVRKIDDLEQKRKMSNQSTNLVNKNFPKIQSFDTNDELYFSKEDIEKTMKELEIADRNGINTSIKTNFKF